MGAGLTLDKGRGMRRENNSKFGKKRSFEKLAVGDKKGEEVERREIREGGGGRTLDGGGQK